MRKAPPASGRSRGVSSSWLTTSAAEVLDSPTRVTPGSGAATVPAASLRLGPQQWSGPSWAPRPLPRPVAGSYGPAHRPASVVRSPPRDTVPRHAARRRVMRRPWDGVCWESADDLPSRRAKGLAADLPEAVAVGADPGLLERVEPQRRPGVQTAPGE